MAEFKEIMNKWNRLCEYQKKKHNGIMICEDCPLDIASLCPDWPVEFDSSDKDTYDIAEIEHVVTKWDEEHPEPEYPTWAEWLEQMGVIKSIHLRSDSFKSFYSLDGFLKQIPENIAKAVGIKPKNYDVYKEVLKELQKEKKDD